jgi:hypothetical protein
MILSNRRLRLLYMALAGMDMAVLLPWLTNLSIFWARSGDLRAVVLGRLLTQSPLLVFILFWGVMIVYMLLADLLNHAKIQGPARMVAILGMLALTSLVAVRLLLYADASTSDFRWLRETILALVDLLAGVRGEILLIAANYFLWWRVASYTDRSLTFMSVGLSFRLGMLMIIVGSALLTYWSDQSAPAILYMVLFFAFGLAAVALARIDQKAIGAANSSGALLPWDRFAQLWIAIIGILAAALATATLYTPPMLRTALGWFAPVGRLVQWLLAQTAFLIFLLLTPLLEWLAERIQAMMADAPPLEQAENVPPPEPITLTEVVQQFALLRYCIGAGILLIALALILFFFVRIAQRERDSDKEETSATESALRPGGLNFGLDRLKEWFALLGRYGLGNQLLAAISVENIYANLVRLARSRGYPRHPAQGPDSYLPILMQAFPGHEAELNAITTSYLRVRYGERPITAEELAELRAAYAAIIETSATDKGRAATT